MINLLLPSSVPSQIPIMEDTQFVQILHESFDFFNIEEKDYKNFFLIDTKSSKCRDAISGRNLTSFPSVSYPRLYLSVVKGTAGYHCTMKCFIRMYQIVTRCGMRHFKCKVIPRGLANIIHRRCSATERILSFV